MTGFSKEQLEALRRQIEEDYRMDVAAIDRLLRRFSGSVPSAPAPAPASAPASYSPAPTSTPLAAAPMVDAAPAPAASMPSSNAQEPQNDELAGSIRAMFASYRK